MAREWIILAGVMGASVGTLFVVVMIAKFCGIPAEHLHGPTFVFSFETVALVLAALFGPIAIVLGAERIFHGNFAALGLSGAVWRDLAVGFGVGLCIQGLSYLLKAAIGGGGHLQYVIPDVSLAEYFKYAVWYVLALVLNSLSEELVFRAFPLGALARMGLSPWGAVLLASLVFSAIHFLTSEASWSNLVFRTLYGVLLCQIFLKTGSFWLIAGIHTGTNALASFFSDNWRVGGVFNVIWNRPSSAQDYSFAIVLALGIAMTYISMSREGCDGKNSACNAAPRPEALRTW